MLIPGKKMRGYLVKRVRGHLENMRGFLIRVEKGRSSDILDSLTVHSFPGNKSQVAD